MSQTYTIDEFVQLMQRLRHPVTGCPWDIKQSFQSIVPSTLEEVYEVVDAIESGDFDNLKEELGDLLFQVIFYAQMADEGGLFNFYDVVSSIVAKLLRRHPHVFPNGSLHEEINNRPALSDEALATQWEEIKQKEKGSMQSLLADIPVALPALQRAQKIQKKLRSVGFDWQQVEEVFAVVESELLECREACDQKNIEAIESELGDLLFAVVNLARHLKIDPETALRKANKKVEKRFVYVEGAISTQGKTLQEATLDEMEQFWQEAKQNELKTLEKPKSS